MKIPWPLLFGFLGLAMSVAAAQGPRASLRGHVEDENGLPVAGAEVTLQGPEGPPRTAFSDAVGNFEIPALNPGSYHSSAMKPGFFLLENHPLELMEGPNDVSFSLSHEYEVHESVQVVASAEQVDPQRTDQPQTLEAHEILDLPVKTSHDLQAYLPSLPGVLKDNSGALHVGGGRSQETEFTLDGFEIGDPATGELNSRVTVDTVRSVDVNTGSYGAQYAHGGTGVLALNTYIGDDHWRFGTTNFIPGIDVKQGLNFGNWNPRFTLSGPIEKGRAWFSDALSMQHTFSIVSGLPKTGDTTSQWAGDNWLRTQYNITPTHILQGNFLVNQSGDSNLGLGVLSPVSTTTDLRSSRYFGSIKDQIAFQAGLFELGAAFDKGSSTAQPQGSLPYVLTPSGATGNYFQSVSQQTHRWQSIGNLLLASRSWHGTHDLRVGFNVDNTALAQQTARSPIETQNAAGATILTTSFIGPPRFQLSDSQAGGYAQDSWRPLRMLVVEIGGRADWNEIVGRTLWAPRLAANLLPFAGNRSKLTVAWGAYYQPPNLSVLGLAYDQQRVDLFSGQPGLPPGPVVSRFILPGGLRQPYFDTASAGWEQKFGTATFLTVRGMIRNEHDGLAYEFTPANAQGLGGNFLLQNNRRDQFRSIEVSLKRSFHNAEIFGGYTRSRARSNEPLDYALANPVTFLANPLFAAQVPGALPWDAPNRFISYGWTPVPFWSLLVSYSLEYRTGFPYPLVSPYGQLVGPPDQFRFPNYLSLDVGIEKRFHFRGREWAVRLAAVNITDHQNPDSVDNIAGSSRIFAGGQARAFTGRFRLVGESGAGATPAPSPGAPPSYLCRVIPVLCRIAGAPSPSAPPAPAPAPTPSPSPTPAPPAPSYPPATASIYGNTGLWKVLTADTLPVRHASFSTWYDRVNRNPGDLAISTLGFGGAVGVMNRLEVSANLQANQQVAVGQADQLSFGQQALGFFGNKTPASPPLPAELVPGSSRVPQLRFPPSPSGALTGAAGYYDLAPFAGLVGSGGAVGLLSVGAKYKILSESSGDPVGLAVHADFGVPIHKSIDFLMTHPVGTADLQFGFDGIVSRSVGDIAELYWNAGFRHIDQPAHSSVYRLAEEVPLGFGFTVPRKARIQFVGESTAEVFVGSHTPNTTFGAEDPVDLTLGLRAYLGRSFTLSGGYRRPLNQFGGDKNGFTLSLAYSYPGR